MGLPAARAAAGRSSSRASTTRRRSSSTASEVAHHVGAFTPFRVDVPRGRAPARGRRARGARERGAGRQDEPRARAQEPHGLRLGLLPAARPPGHLAAGHARTRRAERFRRVTLADGVGRSRLDGERRCSDVESPELWWPNGMRRAAALPRGRVRTSASARSSSSERGRPTMRFRTRSSSTASGRIRGWNWVPIDVALRRAAAGEARAPAELARARERQPAARVGRRR